VTRPVLIWALLWTLIATAVAVGIVAGFLVLSALDPGAALAASRPAAQPTATVDLSGGASVARLPGAPMTLTVPMPMTPVETAGIGVGVLSSGASPSPSVAASPRPPNREMTRPMRLADAAVTTTGVASWWASFGPGIYAALPGYVAGTRVTIRVWSGKLHVDAPVITSCGCFVGTPQERIVDLSPGILVALGLDPAKGLYPVSVEYLP
jgi:hypothetical protein